MKKKIITLSMFLLVFSLFSNDTYFFRSGGSLIPTEETDTQIEMVEEVISITLNEKYYEVNVNFDFYNHGDTVTIAVGFPYFEIGLSGKGSLYDFKCWTNGKETNYADQPISNDWNNTHYGSPELINAYVRDVTFPAKTNTKTIVNFKSSYGLEAPSWQMADYLYGTGSSWKNKIGKITLIVTNNLLNRRIISVKMAQKNVMNSFTRIEDNCFKAIFKNVEPEYTDQFEITLGDLLGNDGPRRLSKERYDFYYSSATEENLFWYTKAQLRILRNAIYAFHGYKFKSKDLNDYFMEEGKYWWPEYKVNPDFSEDEFTEIEKENIQFILREENRRK